MLSLALLTLSLGGFLPAYKHLQTLALIAQSLVNVLPLLDLKQLSLGLISGGGGFWAEGPGGSADAVLRL